MPVAAEPRDDARGGAKVPRGAGTRQGCGGASEDAARIFIGAGRQAGIRPADLIGAIANEAGLSSRDLGIVQIADRFSIMEMPAASADAVIEAMRRTSLRGQRVSVRRDRDGDARCVFALPFRCEPSSSQFDRQCRWFVRTNFPLHL